MLLVVLVVLVLVLVLVLSTFQSGPGGEFDDEDAMLLAENGSLCSTSCSKEGETVMIVSNK